MSIRRVFPGLGGAVVIACFGMSVPDPVAAQASQPDPSAQQHEHGKEAPPATGTQTGHEGHTMPADQHAGHDMAAMESMGREGSGTAWQPESTPMYAFHANKAGWMLMAHENAFVQFLRDSGDRGQDQFGSVNWFMGMADRKVGTGHLGLRGMFSLEPWTIRGCGYPDLLATGEQCNGQQIHDRQHPHDLFMELAAEYDAPIRGSMRWQVYGGPAGEPALGPVAYPHRLSAMPNPLAPISHHWLDATHITFGLVTAGFYTRRWKAEASVFNGREPDEHRTNIESGALDSVSGRLWLMPTSKWALQASVGRLNEVEPSVTGGPGIDMTRATASATYHRAVRENSIWATTIAWGRNAEPEHATNALLVETNVTLDERHTWFGRFEIVGKTPHDLAVAETADLFTVAKLQGGYTRYLNAWNGLKPGVGFSASAGVIPSALSSTYGGRVNFGFGIFVTLRPAVMPHH